MREGSVAVTTAALLLGASVLVPTQAAAYQQIPFFITNNSASAICVDVGGPWLREGQSNLISPGQQRVNFYSADIDIFPPFGNWEIGLTDSSCAAMTTEIDICVEDQPNITYDGINLVVASDGSIFASNASSPPCDSTSAAAFLGDGGPDQPDQDVFRFHGRAGDRVTLTLGRDGAHGSTGAEASISLRRDGGGPQLAQRHGRVPLTLTASLTQAGQYRVVVEEAGKQSTAGLRGHYRLQLKRSGDAPVVLEPLRNVEP